MAPKTLTYSDEHLTAEIEVRAATVLDGMRRTRLQLEAGQETGGEPDLDRSFLRSITYPAIVAVSTGKITVDGEALPWPPTFEQYLTLPEPLGIQWEIAVYEQNPHWLPPIGEGEDPKKVNAASTG
jgi:hypothetical protein